MMDSSKPDTDAESSVTDAEQAPEGMSSTASTAENAPMPIVGIGASAGGVSALQEFFARIPTRRGWPS